MEGPNAAPTASIRISQAGPAGDTATLRTLGQGVTKPCKPEMQSHR